MGALAEAAGTLVGEGAAGLVTETGADAGAGADAGPGDREHAARRTIAMTGQGGARRMRENYSGERSRDSRAVLVDWPLPEPRSIFAPLRAK